MTSIVDSKKCTGCSACANACNIKCISMCPDIEGFLYPKIDYGKCMNCHKCINTCPTRPESSVNIVSEPKAYAAYSTNDNIVEHSSSGGVFSVLAEYVIQNGGIVFGAAFESPDTVRHIAVRECEELERLRRSKYVQSEIGQCYQDVEFELKQQKIVLFSGTPCQIAGLRHYLQRDYNNLLCVDIICHSVPSPKIWRDFLKETSIKGNSKVVSVNFRDKRNDWENYCLSFQLEDGNEYILKGEKNIYMKAFIEGLSNRPSCYHCVFKGNHRESDITLGDYWGVKDVQPEVYNGRGTSIVIANTAKGNALLNNINCNLVIRPALIDMALLNNSAYFRASKAHLRRKKFWLEQSKTNVGAYDSIEKMLSPTKLEKFILSMKKSCPYRVGARLIRYMRGH